MCEVAAGASGKDFIGEVSHAIGAKVKAWDGIYEIRPTGKEWTADPNKKVTQTGDTGRKSELTIYGDLMNGNGMTGKWWEYNPMEIQYRVGKRLLGW